jgi:hypothetical protein
MNYVYLHLNLNRRRTNTSEANFITIFNILIHIEFKLLGHTYDNDYTSNAKIQGKRQALLQSFVHSHTSMHTHIDVHLFIKEMNQLGLKVLNCTTLQPFSFSRKLL